MVTGAYLLITLGGILYLAGWVMLIVTAFRISTGWGLVILFLSWLLIPLVIFLIMNWAEARSGFLIMLAGMIAGGLGGFVLVGSVATSAMAEFDSFDMAPSETTGPMVFGESEESETPSPSLDQGAEYEDYQWPTPSPVVEQIEEVDQPEPDISSRTYVGQTGMGNRIKWVQLANVEDLAGHLGELIELRLKDGEVLRVTLTAVTGDTLQVSQRVGGGRMGYSVQKDLIDEIYVMR